MRLFEVDNRIVDDLVTALRMLRGRNDVKNKDPNELPTFTYGAINQILSNIDNNGINLNKELLTDLVKANPSVNQIIKTFDDTTLTLNAHNETPEEPMDVPQGPSVDQMAHSGAQSHLNTLA